MHTVTKQASLTHASNKLFSSTWFLISNYDWPDCSQQINKKKGKKKIEK